MSVFASADRKVGAQYHLLEQALRGRLPPEGEIDSKVRAFVFDELKELAPAGSALRSISDVDPDISEEKARELIDCFRDAASLEVRPHKRILSAGGVSFTFSGVVYLILQSRKIPVSVRRAMVLEVCDIAETRPLPVMRWTEFVRASIGDETRVCTVMRSCIYSKTLLDSRLKKVVGTLSAHLNLPADRPARILAIGSSGTVMDALAGLSQKTKIAVSSTLPTPGITFNRDANFELNDVDHDDLLAGRVPINFDLIVMGCGVVGKTADNKIEIVNWARDIALATHVRQSGVPLVVIGGLYKIWPQEFYALNKSFAVDRRRGAAASADAVLTESDIDWLVTERQVANFSHPTGPSWVDLLFASRSLDVAAGLSLCVDDVGPNGSVPAFLQSQKIRDIDNALGLLGSGMGPRRVTESKGAVAYPGWSGSLEMHQGQNPDQADSGANAPHGSGGAHRTSGMPIRPAGEGEFGFKAFKAGLFLIIAGLACWFPLLASNKVEMALGASIFAAIGANILMLGVLGERSATAKRSR